MSNVFSCVCTVGRDAEVRYLPSGSAVLNVTVANNVGFGDKQKTNWIRVVIFGKRAEGDLKNYLVKGQQVFVSGELTMQEFNKNDGTKGFQLEVNASILDLIGKKSDSPTPAQQGGYVPPHEQHRRDVEQHNAQQAPPPYDDDIPF
jgi:single-strand DNA-binding protein